MNLDDSGISLIELLLTMGLMALLIPALTTGFVASRDSIPQENNRSDATALLNEAIESIRIAREDAWSNVSSDGTYHPEISGNTWNLASGPETINDIFERQIVISAVQRDGNGNIVASGGTTDPSTKEITVSVTWETPREGIVEASYYVSRHINNAAWTQTSQLDFDNGTFDDTQSTGNVGSSEGTWEAPQIGYTYDIERDSNGNATTIDSDYLYTVADNDANGDDFYIFDLVNPETPGFVSSLELGSDIFDVKVSGDYAFLANDSNNEGLLIIDISNKNSPTLAYTMNLGNIAFRALAISGNTLYITSDANGGGSELFVIDISSPTSPSILGQYEHGSAIGDIVIDGSYAYIATQTNSAELTILDVSTSNPTVAGSYDLTGTFDGLSIDYANNYAFIGTQDAFHILDVSNFGSISQEYFYDFNANVNGIAVEGDVAIAVGEGTSIELTAFDISTIASTSVLGSADLSGVGFLDITLANNIAYTASYGDSTELTVIKGGFGHVTAGTVILDENPLPPPSTTWDNPSIADTYDDSTGSDGNAVFVAGDYAYLVTDNSNGSDPELSIIDITDPENMSFTGGINIGVDVTDVAVSGDYAYLTSTHNSAEFTVVDVSNKASPSIVTYLDLPDGSDARTILIEDDYAYVGQDWSRRGTSEEFLIIDISTPSSPSIEGAYDIETDVNDIVITGDYAYAATRDQSAEVTVFDISNKSSPTPVGAYNMTLGNYEAISLAIRGDTLYAGTFQTSGDEFYILDITNRTNPALLYSENISADITGINIQQYYALVVLSSATGGLAIYDVTTPNSPTYLTTLQLSNGSSEEAGGITVSGNFAYVTTENDSSELYSIEGGVPSNLYLESGTYTSQTFDAGAEVAFNNLYLTLYEPIVATDVNVQVAINADNSTWNYVGPDGTAGTYYENTDKINLNNTIGQYLRFRTYFTGDGTATPVLEHVSINYSP